MSKLSKLFHDEKRNVFHQVIVYLENIDIPKEQKARIAVAILKQLHLSTGGQWDDEMEQGVIYVIDFILGEIRHWSQDFENRSTLQVPPIASIYDHWTTGTIPDDSGLLQMGFKTTDAKYQSEDNAAWRVSHAGGVVSGDGRGGTAVFLGFIGG